MGSIVYSGEYCEKDIRSRIAMWKKPLMDNGKLLFNSILKRIITYFVWSVALYAA